MSRWGQVLSTNFMLKKKCESTFEWKWTYYYRNVKVYSENPYNKKNTVKIKVWEFPIEINNGDL